MIPVHSGWIWIRNQFYWKCYLLTFTRRPITPQLDVVCDLDISSNVNTSWMSWNLDVEIVLAILVKSGWVGPGTNAIRNIISSSFRASCTSIWIWGGPGQMTLEHPNLISYAFCTSIWIWGGPGLRVELEVRLWNSEFDWISTLICASPCLCSALLMSHWSSSLSPRFLTIIKSLDSNRFSK
jgi:hypothetical protein